MKRLAYILSLICLVLLIQNCKPKEVPPQPSTSIVLTVTAENATGGTSKISDAEVYLFKSVEDYSSFVGSNATLSNYVQKGTTDSEGKYTFCDLEADSVEYFFYAQKGNLNNNKSQYRMGGILYKNAAHYVTLELNGTIRKKVLFYSNDASIVGNNIKIYLSENGELSEKYTLSQIGDKNATVSDNGTYVFAPDNGSYTYYIKNKNGCIWTKEITVLDDTEEIIELAPCGTTEFKFYSSDFTSGNIKVYLNNESKEIGTISSFGSPTSNFISSYRPNGTYTYRAVHSNGTCTWIGSTTGTAIDLKDCN